MNKIMVSSKASFEDCFDRVVIQDSAEAFYLLDCDDREAPNYNVALMPVVIDNEGDMQYSPTTIIWSCRFYAVNDLNKRGMLSSMLATLEVEENLDCPIRLQKEFGGTINGLYVRPGQA